MSLTVEDVRLRIAVCLGVDQALAQLGTPLADLVSDSFRLVEMAIEIQEDYDIVLGHADMAPIYTVGQLAALVRSRVVTS